MYWKRTGSWPSVLLAKQGDDPQPFGSAGANIVIMSSHFVYEKTPHDDALLDVLRLPRLGVDLTLTEISLYDVLCLEMNKKRYM